MLTMLIRDNLPVIGNPRIRSLLRVSTAIGGSVFLISVGIRFRDLSGAIWRFNVDVLSAFPEWLGVPLLVFATLYTSCWFFDRWFQRLQYFLALNLAAVIPWLPDDLSRMLLLGLLLPLIAWFLMVMAPGRTGAREQRYQVFLTVLTTVTCLLSLMTGWYYGGHLLRVSFGLFALCVARCIVMMRRGQVSPVDDEITVGEYWKGSAFVVAFIGGTFSIFSFYPTAGDTMRYEMDGNREFSASAGLFVIADNQYHYLDGADYPEQFPPVTTVAPVGRRPPMLDVLSEITLNDLASVYRLQASAFELDNARVLGWAHLGDFADISCRAEIDRFDDIMTRFVFDGNGGRLIGVAAGNHDGYFIGNYGKKDELAWQEACSGEPAGRAYVLKYLSSRLPETSTDSVGAEAGEDARPSFLASVAEIGEVCVEPIQIIAVFLDTSESRPANQSDGRTAGLTGHVSAAQVNWVRNEIRQIGTSAGKPPLVVLMAHHPFERLTPWAQEELLDLFEELGPNLLAYVSAHTHKAANRGIWTVEQGLLPEFIVGSTTDPPQEARLFEFGVRNERVVIRSSRRFPRTEMCMAALTSRLATGACANLGQASFQDVESYKGLDYLGECLLGPAYQRDWSARTLLDQLRTAAESDENRESLVCLASATSELFGHSNSSNADTLAEFIGEVFAESGLSQRIRHENEAAYTATVTTRFDCRGTHAPAEYPVWRRWLQGRRDLEGSVPAKM